MKLREYLALVKKSCKQAAFELGVPQPVLNRWITGVRTPRAENMQRIFQWSNGVVTPNDFYSVSNDNNEPLDVA